MRNTNKSPRIPYSALWGKWKSDLVRNPYHRFSSCDW